jgi:hypothetical protein
MDRPRPPRVRQRFLLVQAVILTITAAFLHRSQIPTPFVRRQPRGPRQQRPIGFETYLWAWSVHVLLLAWWYFGAGNACRWLVECLVGARGPMRLYGVESRLLAD